MSLFPFSAFRYNSITVLRENDLSGLENLELLMLHSNTIDSIEDRAFQDLRSLQVKSCVCQSLVSIILEWSSSWSGNFFFQIISTNVCMFFFSGSCTLPNYNVKFMHLRWWKLTRSNNREENNSQCGFNHKETLHLSASYGSVQSISVNHLGLTIISHRDHCLWAQNSAFRRITKT